jgi:hypothetical protein
MKALARKTAVEYGLIVAVLVALVYGLRTPAGGVRADGQGTGGANGTPVVVGTPLAPAPPAPTLPPSSDPDVPAPDAPPDAPTPATAPVATRPRPPTTPGGTPVTAPATPQASAIPSTTPTAGPTPLATLIPTATPTRRPSGTVGATIIRDLSPLGFTLNGRDQVAPTTLDIAVEDTAPATRQPGWTLTLSVAQFQIAGNAARALPADAVTLVGVRVTCVGDAACTMPENTVAYPLVMPVGVALPIYSAASGSGSGSFVVTPTFAVRVPATAYTGSYTTTLVVNAARGAPGLAAQSQGAAPVATPTATAPPRPISTAVAPTPTPFVAPTVLPVAPAPTPTVVPEPSGEPPIEPTASAPPPAFTATDRIGTAPTQGLLPTGTRLAATGATRTVGGVLWRQFALADGRSGWVRDLDVLPVAR